MCAAVQLLRSYSRDAVALRLKHLALACRGAETHSIVVMVRMPCTLPLACGASVVVSSADVPECALSEAAPRSFSASHVPAQAPLPCTGHDRVTRAQDVPGIEAGSMLSKIDSLLFFLPKGLKAKVKAKILAQRDYAMQKARALRINKHAGKGKDNVVSVSTFCSHGGKGDWCSWML